jgi:alkanesulfonate monooxygenase SsuD/methylene tetrahydromethanopterin reductase-like flavin-dependent oxidoreductase (luciferase family)
VTQGSARAEALVHQAVRHEARYDHPHMVGGEATGGRVDAVGAGAPGPARPTVGLVLPTFPQSTPLAARRLPQVVAEAEALGVDALWACDHLFWHGPVLEAMTALTLAATASSRCTIGTAVLQLALRSPAVVAKTAASLQELSGGRLVLGVGAGAHQGEFTASGVDFAGRGALLDRALDQLDQHWTAGGHPYEQLPRPAPIPVWVGGSGDPALRRAARRGRGWMPMFLAPDALRSRYRQLDAELVLAGRRPADVTRSTLLFLHTGRDGGAARRQGLAWMSSLYRLPESRLERHIVAGEPHECVERLASYVDAGVEHLCLFVADDDPLPHLDAIIGDLRVATTRRATTPRARTVQP